MAAVEGGHERAADLGIDLGGLEFGKGPHADGTTHAVDQQVDATMQLDRTRHRGLCAGIGFEVGDPAGSPSVRCLHRNVMDEVGPVHHHDLAAFGGDAHGYALQDALGRAGDDGHLAREASTRERCAHAATATGWLVTNFS